MAIHNMHSWLDIQKYRRRQDTKCIWAKHPKVVELKRAQNKRYAMQRRARHKGRTTDVVHVLDSTRHAFKVGHIFFSKHITMRCGFEELEHVRENKAIPSILF
jgi:hypothetical protein